MGGGGGIISTYVGLSAFHIEVPRRQKRYILTTTELVNHAFMKLKNNPIPP